MLPQPVHMQHSCDPVHLEVYPDDPQCFIYKEVALCRDRHKRYHVWTYVYMRHTHMHNYILYSMICNMHLQVGR